MIPTPPVTVSAPVEVLEDPVFFEIYTADAIVIRPLFAPTLIAVAPPPMLSVVATVFHKACVALVPAIVDDAIVIVPLAAPTLIAVAAPPMLSVVEFVFIKLNVEVLLVVKSPQRLIPRPTANVFPIPTPPVTTRAPAVLEVVS